MDAILVAAMSINGVIGVNNKIPWHLPMDLERFKKITWGQAVIMGNNTFNSLGRKPLKRRSNIVLTRNVYFKPEEEVYKVKDFDEAIALFPYRKEIYVIGGEETYRLAMEKMNVKKMYLTVVHEYFQGDTYFPEFDRSKFECAKIETHEQNGLEFSFMELNRIE